MPVFGPERARRLPGWHQPCRPAAEPRDRQVNLWTKPGLCTTGE